MTVIDLPFRPSRAGSLPLVGGDLALDFANTQSGFGYPSHQDHLHDAGNVVDWLVHAKGVSPEDGRLLHEEAARRGDVANDLLERAIALRSAIHDVGAAVGHASEPPPDALATLSGCYARCVAEGSLAIETGACGWRWDMRKSPVEAALGPIALAAVRLFGESDFARIKECQGHACGWLFHDTSKNNRRRWCEMEVCGNRAKQKRLTARRRGK